MRSRVANIAAFLSEPLDVHELRQRIVQRIWGSLDPPLLELGETDWSAVQTLVERKYGTWEWNYGRSPACNVQRAKRFATGEVDLRIQVEHG